MHDILVSRCNEGEFYTLFKTLHNDPMKHKHMDTEKFDKLLNYNRPESD
jgi:hypothetical protein